MELHGVAGLLSVDTLIFYQILQISQGWRDFLARIQIHSSTKPMDKNEARKTLPFLHHKKKKLPPANCKNILEVVSL
jgi:hypothetical protein